jgi:hypothetical protein
LAPDIRISPARYAPLAPNVRNRVAADIFIYGQAHRESFEPATLIKAFRSAK